MATKKKVTTPAIEVVTGFKVTDSDFKCRGTQYELGKDFVLPGSPTLCHHGYHFCRIANDCFNYYDFDTKNRVFEVEAFGETEHGEDKSATVGIRFVRELSWQELLGLVNQGKANTGRGNSGNRNSGDLNSGDLNSGNRNSGNRNSGNRNSGNRNSGNRNSGDRNSGDRNSGNRNSGDLNSGDWNSGDWNSGDRNSGVFCTDTPATISFFNQPSEWSYADWTDSEAYWLKNEVRLTEWRSWSDMTDQEKEEYPRAETAEGYLKRYDYKEAHRTWWAALDKRQQGVITSLPNFSKEVFTSITGIQLD